MYYVYHFSLADKYNNLVVIFLKYVHEYCHFNVAISTILGNMHTSVQLQYNMSINNLSW